jgi:hypothetical protein
MNEDIEKTAYANVISLITSFESGEKSGEIKTLERIITQCRKGLTAYLILISCEKRLKELIDFPESYDFIKEQGKKDVIFLIDEIIEKMIPQDLCLDCGKRTFCFEDFRLRLKKKLGAEK